MVDSNTTQQRPAAPPAPAEKHHALGLEAMNRRRLDAAIGHFSAALACDPRHVPSLANLASALQSAGRPAEALDGFDRALVLAPGHPGIHHNRGNALLALGRAGEAAAAQARASALAPGEVRFLHAWGLALERADRLEEAEDRLRAALALAPGHAPSSAALALLRLARGDAEEALSLWRDQAARARRVDPPVPYGTVDRLANRSRIRHDLEQFRWLLSASGDPAVDRAAIERLVPPYEALLRIMPDGDETRRPVALTDPMLAALGHRYNRAIHRLEAPAVAGDPFSNRDWGRVEEAYHADAPGIVWVDDFLEEAALRSLRRFCFGSTIFHHVKHGGYVGSYLPEVACGLLAQIAAELPRRLPSVIRHHRLRQMWIYKYDGQMEGIGTHADAAAVNVNFWLTPDEANLDPSCGGLVIHRCEAPLDWSFQRFNADEDAIAAHLARHDAGSLKVDYRCNRAIIFHSDLFHATDRFSFRDRYEDRRLNVTMLFGDRADGR